MAGRDPLRKIKRAVLEFIAFLILLVITFFMLAGPADAEETAYMWVERDGAVAFTDDPARIPEAYFAVEIVVERWEDYPRLTIVDSAARRVVEAAQAERLERLREENGGR